jgi:hypothetical protein
MYNRLRTGGDQFFPLGWAMVLQKAGGHHHVAHAVASIRRCLRSAGDVEHVDNADINQRLMETIEWITSYSQQIRSAIEDGVIDAARTRAIEENSTRRWLSGRSIQRWCIGFFAPLKRMTPASVQLRASWRIAIVWRTNA